MSEEGLAAWSKRKFKATTNSKHRRPISENVLARNFTTYQPNQVWLADITYIWTRMGWLYLATVMHVFSRRIVGWALEERMTKEFACRALQMAITRRSLAGG